MVARQTLVEISVVLLTAFAVVVPAASAAPLALAGSADGTAVSQFTAAQTTNDSQAGGEGGNATGNESAFGTQMTAFMQSSAAQAKDSVDNGMWEAAFERANESERARLAERRVEKLDDRLADLAEQNRTLSDRYRNGSISYGEFVSEASELSGRMEAMEEGVNGTDRAARRAGLNVSGLTELQTTVRNASGPEVAGVARGLASGDRGPPEGVPGGGPDSEDGERRDGPPEDVPGGPNDGANGNATTDSANETGSPQAPGSPGNATQGPGNRGNGSDRGQGPGDDAPGNSGGDDDAPGNSGGDDDAPGNSGGDDDAPGNSGAGDDAPGNSDSDDDATEDADSDDDSEDGDDDASEEGDRDDDASDEDGDDGPGNGGPGNSGGQGNSDDASGRGPAGLLTGDILINW